MLSFTIVMFYILGHSSKIGGKPLTIAVLPCHT